MASSLLSTEPTKSFIQEVALSIATILDLHVTVADSSLVRVAGTGPYAAGIGEQLPRLCSFGTVLHSHAPFLVSHPREELACWTCDRHDDCKETCHLAFPLDLDGNPVGVLSLVAFSAEQRQRLVQRQVEYSVFLGHMARLVAMSLRSEASSRLLAEERDRLSGIVDAIAEGILAVDGAGTVVCCNRVASSVLDIENRIAVGKPLSDIFPESSLLRVLQTGEGYVNREVSVPGRAGRVRHVSSATPLRSQGRVVGAVAVLRTAEDARNMVYELSGRQPDMAIDHILGNDPALHEAKKMALVAAAGNATILLTGESGTGKEIFARAIHFHSPRSHRPFVAVNCAALPEDLLESELFGYEEGAFTGAKRGGKPGKFELASGGTLFLDEVGDCSLRLQAKLLRALDRREIQRVGGTTASVVDVRVLAATNKDLETMVQQGEFRGDLYYRLSVIPINIPPLRERKGDIPLLLDAMLTRYSNAMNTSVPGLTPGTRTLLEEYNWPGNVRELENAVQYMLHASSGGPVEPRHLPPRIRGMASLSQSMPATAGRLTAPALPLPASAWEKNAIAQGLRRHAGKPNAKELVARDLGVSRSTIYRKIKRYRLE